MATDYEDFEAQQDDELELKIKFADAWLRNPNNAFEAALTVTKGEPSKALCMSSDWIYDNEVLQLKAELVEKYGEEYFLPSKAAMLQDIYTRARKTPQNDDYVKLMKLAADMRGMLSDKSNVNINTTITQNKVMIVPTFVDSAGKLLDDNAWEQKLIQQQQRLVAQ